MKYRLKDQFLQKRLDEVTGGNFSHRLQDNDFVKRMEIKGRNVAVTLLLLTEEIEPIPEYTTKGWNPFPEVTPPEGVWMRLEVFRSNFREQHTYRYYAKFLKSEWKNGEGGKVDIREGDYVRFRPWEDEE